MNGRANYLVKLLKQKKLSIAMAESVTCGLATELLVNSIGTSDILKGSVICYSPEIKHTLMGISKKKSGNTPASRCR